MRKFGSVCICIALAITALSLMLYGDALLHLHLTQTKLITPKIAVFIKSCLFLLVTLIVVRIFIYLLWAFPVVVDESRRKKLLGSLILSWLFCVFVLFSLAVLCFRSYFAALSYTEIFIIIFEFSLPVGMALEASSNNSIFKKMRSRNF